jgi:hypothetical protein
MPPRRQDTAQGASRIRDQSFLCKASIANHVSSADHHREAGLPGQGFHLELRTSRIQLKICMVFNWRDIIATLAVNWASSPPMSAFASQGNFAVSRNAVQR